jgi:hypothetical protein
MCTAKLLNYLDIYYDQCQLVLLTLNYCSYRLLLLKGFLSLENLTIWYTCVSAVTINAYRHWAISFCLLSTSLW